MSNLVPFGKYKGQPLEVLQSDPAYVEWLMAQDGFRQRYPQIVSVIINNFGEPEETPEHNALQIKFLDESYRRKLTAVISGHDNAKLSDFLDPVFESDAVDCRFSFNYEGYPYSVIVEIKPQIGDDYPAVLRQIMSLRPNVWRPIRVVVCERITSLGATEDQIRKFFSCSGVHLITTQQIDAIEI